MHLSIVRIEAGIQRAAFRFVLRLSFVAMICFCGPLHAQISDGTRIDVAYGNAISLKQLGGPNVDIVVYERNMGVVHFGVIDKEHVVVSAQTDVDSVRVNSFAGTATVTGTNHVIFSPTVSRHTLRVGHGFEYVKEHREASFMYEASDGLRVYYLDSIDTRQNQCALLLVAAPPRSTNNSSESNEERLRRLKTLENEGIVSAEEAR